MFYKTKNKLFLIGVSFVLVAALGFTGCGMSKNGGKSDSNGILTISMDTGATNQFVRSFNGTDVNLGAQPLFYELLYQYLNDGSQVPRLASGPIQYSYRPFEKSDLANFEKGLKEQVKIHEKDGAFEKKGTKEKFIKSRREAIAKGVEVQTVPLKSGIKWNDGVPFTAKDVAFTYRNNQPTYCHDLWNCFYYNAPKAINDTTVEFTYNRSLMGSGYAGQTIKPEHIYNKSPKEVVNNGSTTQQITHLDLSKYIDKDPVGTGPGKLLSFTPGKVKIGWRDDYWGGKTNGVKEIDFVPQGPSAKAQGDITSGKSDWAQSYVNDVQTVFVSKSPDNHYQYFPNGGSRGIMFNVRLAPVNDVAVRKALAYSIDLTEPQKAVNIGYEIPSITGLGLTNPRWASWIDPEYRKPVEPNIEQAKKWLIDAGWTINSNGNLEKAGKEYPLTLRTSTTELPEDMIIMPIIKKQWETNLGLNVKFLPLGDTPYQAGKNDGKFQMFTDSTVDSGITTASAYWIYGWDTYNNDNITNYLVSTQANDAIIHCDMVNRVTDWDKITRYNQIAGKSMGEGVPFIPYEENGTGVMWSTKHWTNWPDVKSKIYPTLTSYTSAYHFMIDTIKALKPA